MLPQAAGEALPADVVQLQREVLRLASGSARETRYAMLANAMLLLLAPLPNDIAEQACPWRLHRSKTQRFPAQYIGRVSAITRPSKLPGSSQPLPVWQRE